MTPDCTAHRSWTLNRAVTCTVQDRRMKKSSMLENSGRNSERYSLAAPAVARPFMSAQRS